VGTLDVNRDPESAAIGDRHADRDDGCDLNKRSQVQPCACRSHGRLTFTADQGEVLVLVHATAAEFRLGGVDEGAIALEVDEGRFSEANAGRTLARTRKAMKRLAAGMLMLHLIESVERLTVP
jgi:hypothetical protein